MASHAQSQLFKATEENDKLRKKNQRLLEQVASLSTQLQIMSGADDGKYQMHGIDLDIDEMAGGSNGGSGSKYNTLYERKQKLYSQLHRRRTSQRSS